MTDREKLVHLQMKIMDEIKRICECNNIDYFLDSGTLLGAVRHKGYISRDDAVMFCHFDDYKLGIWKMKWTIVNLKRKPKLIG